MDDLDANLLEAWERVMARCRVEPGEAMRRWRRTRQVTFLGPPRAWCLAIRASDTRLVAGWNAWTRDPARVEERLPHKVYLDGALLRELTAPVEIPWPGEPLSRVAAKVGRHVEALRSWLPIRPGRTREARAKSSVRRWEPIRRRGCPLTVRYEAASPHGHFGYDVPVVWSEGPLDPNAWRGAPPHPLWGTLWQGVHEKILKDCEVKLTRLPRMRERPGRMEFKGWEWRCPGRINPARPKGARLPCGRRALMLYGPLPIYTIARFLGEGDGLELADADAAGAGGLAIAGRWHPGWSDPRRDHLCFACAHCWKVRRLSLSCYAGWNEFVTYISGGLLYGREVKKPAWVVEERKRPYQPRPRRARSVQTPSLARSADAG